MSQTIDLTGNKYGRLTVLEKAQHSNTCTNAMWVCVCECGNVVTVRGTCLRSGNTKSCGCYRSEYWRERKTTHGMSHKSIAHIWYGIKQRCISTTSHAYSEYGGRGITVCQEWQDSFEAFYNYVSQLPHYGEKGYSLDRINNDGNYEPGNVRWATKKEQANNRRNRRYHKKPVRDMEG